MKTLERGCVHSIGCWTGCPVRSLRIVRFFGVICTWSPWVKEQSQVWQTLSETCLDASKEIYNPHPGKQVGSLDSARNPAEAPLTEGSLTPPSIGALHTWRDSYYWGDLETNAYHQLYCSFKRCMTIKGNPYLGIHSSIHSHFTPSPFPCLSPLSPSLSSFSIISHF